jgi:hypothetical protein
VIEPYVLCAPNGVLKIATLIARNRNKVAYAFRFFKDRWFISALPAARMHLK